MNARALFLVSLSVVIGFALGRRTTSEGEILSLATSARPEAEPPGGSLDDPVGEALAELTGEKDLASFARLGSALSRLDSAQMARLLDHVERNPVGFVDPRLSFLIARWVERDPSAAADWMRPRLDAAAQDGVPGLSFNQTARGQLINAWTTADPKAAFEYAKGRFRTGLAAKLLDVAIQKWPEKDPARRLAIIQQFPAGKARDEAARNHLWRWANKDPQAALAVTQGIPDEAERRRAQVSVLKRWTEHDAAAAFEQYQVLGINDSYLLSRIIENGAAKDPRRAVEWLTSLSQAEIARNAPTLVQAWAERDPAAAFSWALENNVALAQKHQFTQTVEHNGLTRTTSTMGREYRPLAKAFEVKPEETLAWIRSLPVEADRNRMLEMVVGLAKTGDEGVALMNELPKESAERAAFSVGNRFRDNLDSGRAWADSLPAGRTKWQAWKGLGAADTESTIQLPPGPERDAYISGRAFGSGSRNSPLPTFELIAQVGDPVLKRDLFDFAVEEVARFSGSDWLQRSLDWLEEADVPEEWKQSWRAMAK